MSPCYNIVYLTKGLIFNIFLMKLITVFILCLLVIQIYNATLKPKGDPNDFIHIIILGMYNFFTESVSKSEASGNYYPFYCVELLINVYSLDTIPIQV